MGTREVPKWEFWIVERALRDGKRTSKMKVVKDKRENLLAILLRTLVVATTHILKRHSWNVYSRNILDPFLCARV